MVACLLPFGVFGSFLLVTNPFFSKSIPLRERSEKNFRFSGKAPTTTWHREIHKIPCQCLGFEESTKYCLEKSRKKDLVESSWSIGRFPFFRLKHQEKIRYRIPTLLMKSTIQESQSTSNGSHLTHI